MAGRVAVKIVDAYRGEARDLGAKISAMLVRANIHGNVSIIIRLQERRSASKVTKDHTVTTTSEF